MITEPGNHAAIEKKKLKPHEHIIAGLPLVLLAIGGAIGGGVGGCAYAISVSIFRKELSSPKRYIFSLLVSAGAFVAYFAILVGLTIAFPNLFKK
jgi:hypothetical protein